MDKQKTGELIKEARVKKGYTQLELGDMIGVSNKAISRWEKGETFPDVGLLGSISSILDLTIEELVSGEKENQTEENCMKIDNQSESVSAKTNTALEEIIYEMRHQNSQKKRFVLFGAGFTLMCLFYIITAWKIFTGREVWLNFIIDSFGSPSAFGSISVIIKQGLIFTVIFAVFAVINMVAAQYMKQEKYITAEQAQKENNISLVYKLLTVCTAISGIYLLAAMFANIFAVQAGTTLFGIELSKVGFVLNLQIEIVFVLNLAVMVVCFIRSFRVYENNMIYVIFAQAVMTLCLIYSGILHRMDACTSSVIVGMAVNMAILIVVLGVVLSYRYRTSKNKSNDKE